LLGVESADGRPQCIKLRGAAGAVAEAGAQAVQIARRMGADARLIVMAGPDRRTDRLADAPPAFVPLLGIHDARVKREETMKPSDRTGNQQALGLLETQGLVAALHATDEMLKSAAVELVGKEKIGAAYVTIMIRGDVAAVQAAVATGRQCVERLGGTLIMADVIPRPHPELAALPFLDRPPLQEAFYAHCVDHLIRPALQRGTAVYATFVWPPVRPASPSPMAPFRPEPVVRLLSPDDFAVPEARPAIRQFGFDPRTGPLTYHAYPEGGLLPPFAEAYRLHRP